MNRKQPQDDIPYEVQMMNIIKGYRSLQKKLDYIVPYTQSLEVQNQQLREIISKYKQLNEKRKRELIDRRREVKRLTASNEFFEWKVEKLESYLKSLGFSLPENQ